MNISEKVSDEIKSLFIETAKSLKGYQRRLFMARTVKSLGRGGLKYAREELGWNKDTIWKGQNELRTGLECYDAGKLRGRKSSEVHLPTLREDIKEIVDSQSQTDATFETEKLYTRLSAEEVRKQLIEQKGYEDEALPTAKTIGIKLNEMGYHLKKVVKSKPKKKIAETDAIFARLAEIKEDVAGKETTLRMSLDAKATIKIGKFSRGGKSRMVVKALDHDFQPEEKVTPFGIFLPDYDRLFLYLTTSRVTSDFIVDCIEDCWQQIKADFPHVTTLLLYQDNGPESHSRRTQFMFRMTQFTHETQLIIQLAYYPPYHSKYNPIERVWGRLEQHWNGELLDSVHTVLQYAHTMSWKKKNPVVKLVTTVYETGKKLTQKAMTLLERRFEREDTLGKWFLKIKPCPPNHS